MIDIFDKEYLPPTPPEEIDAALGRLSEKAEWWAGTSVEERIRLLERVMEDTRDVAEEWVRDACLHKGISFDDVVSGEEWLVGPALTIRIARLMRDSLRDISRAGTPVPPGPITQYEDGRTIVGVFPTSPLEKALYPGITAQEWMEPGVTPENLSAHQAAGYSPWETPVAGVCGLLGAGNVTGIAPMDAISLLIVDHKVVCLKLNPVNEYMGRHLEHSLAAFIEAGVLEIIYGGAETGQYLCFHDLVDTIHVTGSQATHDAIVFGTGDDAAERKANDDPVNPRPVTAELANLSPFIIVPGPWTDAELRYQARHIATSLTNNAGFNCNATRVIVTHAEWKLREALLTALGEALDEVPERAPYYPGAVDRWQAFVDAHPEAQVFGDVGDRCVPWTLIEGLDPDAEDEICFTTESFNGVTSEVALDAPRDVAEYIRQAVEFCNEKVWGSLNVTILVHPTSLKDPAVAEAVEQAIADLRYGSIGVNVWAGIAYALVTPTWGAHPGHPRNDIQTGVGTVHNSFLFTKPQKSVVRAPFISRPTPLWVSGHRTLDEVAKRLVDLEAGPSWAQVPALLAHALRA
ncbi:MAG: aldehyde dehydrogenase [Acidimicrobiia bacterium]|nr:aldehyde dehydrogenase [Acidimicrobiia bacterium]